MKPQPSRSPYFARAERVAFELGGWNYVANRLGITAEALKRVVGRTHTKPDRHEAKRWCELVERLREPARYREAAE